eukprot:gene3758-4701_t
MKLPIVGIGVVAAVAETTIQTKDLKIYLQMDSMYDAFQGTFASRPFRFRGSLVETNDATEAFVEASLLFDWTQAGVRARLADDLDAGVALGSGGRLRDCLKKINPLLDEVALVSAGSKDPSNLLVQMQAGATVPIFPVLHLDQLQVPKAQLHCGGDLHVRPGGLVTKLVETLEGAGIDVHPTFRYGNNISIRMTPITMNVVDGKVMVTGEGCDFQMVTGECCDFQMVTEEGCDFQMLTGEGCDFQMLTGEGCDFQMLQEFVDCPNIGVGSPCFGYDTCPDLFRGEKGGMFPPETAADDFSCYAFPNGTWMGRIWAVLVINTVLIPVNTILISLFSATVSSVVGGL